MPQVDIITGDKRVRQWTQEEKLSIVEAAFAPGAVAAHMAKRVNVSTGQLYTWRKQLMSRKPSGGNGFARVVTVTETAVPGPKLSPPSPATEPTSLVLLRHKRGAAIGYSSIQGSAARTAWQASCERHGDPLMQAGN